MAPVLLKYQLARLPYWCYCWYGTENWEFKLQFGVSSFLKCAL